MFVVSQSSGMLGALFDLYAEADPPCKVREVRETLLPSCHNSLALA